MSMGMIAVGLTVTSGAMGATSAYFGARAQKSALGFQADMADINAALAETTAQSTLQAGQVAEQRTRLQTAQLKGRQRAAMGASGTALDEGSNAEILTTTDYMGEVDANTVAANAISQAWGYRAQATNFATDARMKRSAAQAISPNSAVFTSLLGSATQAASTWYAGSKTNTAPPSGGQGPNANKLGGFWGSN